MSREEVGDAFVRLTREAVDDRCAPDRRRRGQFRRGWEDAAIRDRRLGEGARQRVTWYSLGYRYGEEFGGQEPSAIDCVFEVLAELHEDGRPLTSDEIRQTFPRLTRGLVDERRAPDHRRRGQFRLGWDDATRGELLGENALRRVTWYSLGFRYGEEFGPQNRSAISGAFEVLAEGYEDGTLRVGAPAWQPRTTEDRLLQRYADQRGSGRIYVEVPVAGQDGGQAPPGAPRRIDGVGFPSVDGEGIHILRGSEEQFRDDVSRAGRESNGGADVEIIEVKRRLNRAVIGQVLAGQELFEAKHNLRGRLVVVCGEGDDALEWACERLLIEVVAFRD